jgi:hypothetical protein
MRQEERVEVLEAKADGKPRGGVKPTVDGRAHHGGNRMAKQVIVYTQPG